MVAFKNSGGTVLKTVEQSYDVFNRWIRRSIDSDGPGSAAATDTFFSHFESQIALEFDGPTAADLSHRYTWGPAIDQIMADEAVTSLTSAGDVLWALTDHLNTTRDLATYDSVTDVTTIANHRVFDSFGVLISETDTGVNILFGFTARPFDDSTGLQNNLNRWYALGIWLSEDPKGFGANDTNLVRYVGNHPTYATDPDGLQESVSPQRDLSPTTLPPGWLPPSVQGPQLPLPPGYNEPPVFVLPPQLRTRSRTNGWPSAQGPNLAEIGTGQAFLIGGFAGAAQCGQYISYPFRWIPIDWEARDKALEQRWRLSGLDGTATQSATRGAAGVATVAMYSAGVLYVIEQSAAQGYYQVSIHASQRMTQRGVYNCMVRDTIGYGSRRAAFESQKGMTANVVNFFTKSGHEIVAWRNGSEGVLYVFRNIWTNKIITVIFKT